jgi:hypothetical protein
MDQKILLVMLVAANIKSTLSAQCLFLFCVGETFFCASFEIELEREHQKLFTIPFCKLFFFFWH